MLLLIILVAGVSAFEIYGMAKRGQKREILVFAVLAILTLGLGIFYISNPYGDSLTVQVHRLLKKDF